MLIRLSLNTLLKELNNDHRKHRPNRPSPRITSLRIQISDELGKMNVFELGNVLAYCQALPLKNKLEA